MCHFKSSTQYSVPFAFLESWHWRLPRCYSRPNRSPGHPGTATTRLRGHHVALIRATSQHPVDNGGHLSVGYAVAWAEGLIAESGQVCHMAHFSVRYFLFVLWNFNRNRVKRLFYSACSDTTVRVVLQSEVSMGESPSKRS